MIGPTGLTLPLPPEWMRDALCAQVGGDDWFPEKGGPTKAVKDICNGSRGRPPCPVREQCLTYALDNGERFGVWGGLAEAERRRLTRKRVQRPINHGTRGGYVTHRRRGEEPCEACREAERAKHRKGGRYFRGTAA